MCLAPSDLEAKCGGARNCPDHTVGWGPTGYCHGWANKGYRPSFSAWYYVNPKKNAYVTLDYIYKKGGCPKLLNDLELEDPSGHRYPKCTNFYNNWSFTSACAGSPKKCFCARTKSKCWRFARLIDPDTNQFRQRDNYTLWAPRVVKDYRFWKTMMGFSYKATKMVQSGEVTAGKNYREGFYTVGSGYCKHKGAVKGFKYIGKSYKPYTEVMDKCTGGMIPTCKGHGMNGMNQDFKKCFCSYPYSGKFACSKMGGTFVGDWWYYSIDPVKNRYRCRSCNARADAYLNQGKVAYKVAYKVLHKQRGYCRDYKYLKVGKYPARLGKKNPLYHKDHRQECANRCSNEGHRAFYIRLKDKKCACAKSTCKKIKKHKGYRAYRISR